MSRTGQSGAVSSSEFGVTGVDSGQARIRPTVSGWLFGQVPILLAAIVGATSLLIAVGGAPSVGHRVVASLVSLGCLTLLASDWRLAGVELDSAGLTYRRLFRRSRLRWLDVIAVHLRWHSSRSGTGYLLWFDEVPARRRLHLHVPLLRREALPIVAAFLGAHDIGIPVNPVEPWCDRLGSWHGELYQFDPLESIRSIRRAAVGPWEISVVVSASTFRAVTKNVQNASIVRESPPRNKLVDAIEDAVVQVRDAQTRP